MVGLLSLLVLAQPVAAQQRAGYVELGGNGGLFSLNYENIFKEQERWNLGWRAGFALTPVDENNGAVITLPVMLMGTLFPGPNKLEAGLGNGFSITTKGAPFMRGVAALGYRYQDADKPVFLRVMYTPFISYLIDFQWQHWIGISIGYRFKP